MDDQKAKGFNNNYTIPCKEFDPAVAQWERPMCVSNHKYWKSSGEMTKRTGRQEDFFVLKLKMCWMYNMRKTDSHLLYTYFPF